MALNIAAGGEPRIAALPAEPTASHWPARLALAVLALTIGSGAAMRAVFSPLQEAARRRRRKETRRGNAFPRAKIFARSRGRLRSIKILVVTMLRCALCGKSESASARTASEVDEDVQGLSAEC